MVGQMIVAHPTYGGLIVLQVIDYKLFMLSQLPIWIASNYYHLLSPATR